MLEPSRPQPVLTCRRAARLSTGRWADKTDSKTMIRLVGPGGVGKSTTGALLAERLGVSFVDLDEQFNANVGNISKFIDTNGYDAYAARNVSVSIGFSAEVTIVAMNMKAKNEAPTAKMIHFHLLGFCSKSNLSDEPVATTSPLVIPRPPFAAARRPPTVVPTLVMTQS